MFVRAFSWLIQKAMVWLGSASALTSSETVWFSPAPLLIRICAVRPTTEGCVAVTSVSSNFDVSDCAQVIEMVVQSSSTA